MADAGLGLQNLLPLLAEKKRQQDVGARRQEREAKATELYQTIYGGEGTREEKIRAMAQGATMGINFPQSVLGEPKNIDKLFDLIKAPQAVRDDYYSGSLDLDDALQLGQKYGEPPDTDLETIKQMFKEDPRLAASGKTPEQIHTRQQLIKMIGREETNKLLGIKIPSGKGPSALAERRAAVKSIIGDKNITELLEDPKALAELEVTGVSQPELLAMFGVDRKAIIDAQTAIDAEMSAVDPGWKYNRGPILLQWTQGDREGIPKNLLKLLDKYYVPGQDSMKPEGTIEKADELMNLALERAMGGKPAEDLPKHFKPHVLRIVNKGWTKKEARAEYEADKLDPTIELDITDEDFEKILEYIDE